MGNNDPKRYVNRESILKALWEDDIDRISRTKIPARLQKGDEFVDLQLLEMGVQRAPGIIAPIGGVLARKSVAAHTWSRILEQLRPTLQDCRS